MDLRLLKKIMKEFESSSIDKLEIIDKDFTVKMEKNTSSQKVDVLNNDNLEKIKIEKNEKENHYTVIKAPLVGTFYDSPSPESLPFIAVDQRVNKGDVLFILEAMKVMNEIKSPVNGTVRKINVQTGDLVEYSQVILEIEV